MKNQKTYWSSGCGRIELQIDFQDAKACSHMGRCDSDIEWLRGCPYVIEQLDRLDPFLVAKILREYGAWKDEDLANHDANLGRLVWIACCDIVEDAF